MTIQEKELYRDFFTTIPDAENPFAGTVFAQLRQYDNSNRGKFWETFAQLFLSQSGATISPRIAPGHDLIVDGVKTEIKGALSIKGDTRPVAMFNHVGKGKDWEEIWLIVGTPENKIFMAKHNRETLTTINVLKPQQGGNSAGNDDFFITGIKNCLAAFTPANALEYRQIQL